ncbi:hypothetical protein M8818_007247 [Zalaria obscura]|uniref:Uncharacterized protein n=1 Tax=Zalaria obscura TaxID=2024903 RepID=A0ACC3S694_9PEZI
MVQSTFETPETPETSSDGNTLFPQYGFLGCEATPIQCSQGTETLPDPILLNTNTPWSAFLCGSQGSGKSYTLSCMLENCLYSNEKIGKLPEPLAGVVFHNDTRSVGSICEAAYLASLGIEVTVLVSPSNQHRLREAYSKISASFGNLTVKPLLLQSRHLNAEHMNKLMGFTEQKEKVPLYQVVI